MPRPKQPHLKKRKDGRYVCRYKNKYFMGWSEPEVLKAREDYIAQEAAGAYLAEHPTVRDYAGPWLEREKSGVAEQTKREAKILLKRLTDHIGDMAPSEVKPSDIKTVYVEEFKGMSDSYIRSAAQIYRSLFDALMGDGYCVTNPARHKSAKPPAGYTGGHRAITQQERIWIETLCTDHRAHAAVMAMLYAGVRPQEVKAINIDRDIDTESDLITVRESVHLKGHNTYIYTSELKTEYSARTIPLFPPLKKALAGRKGMLIQNAKGKSVTVQAWKSAWESYITCLETAINGCPERWYGKRKQDKGKELPPFIKVTFSAYDLRHSFCTMCRDNGVEINTCIHWMGHKDAKMILKIYDEFSAERGKKEAEKLNKTLFRGQNGGQSENKQPENGNISE